MGEILLPPYLWFTNDNSTHDPRGLAGEINIQLSTSSANQQYTTPDLRQRGLAGEIDNHSSRTVNNFQNSTPDLQQRSLVGEDSHTNINTLKQTNDNQDRRSILINESTVTERWLIIDDDIYKPSVVDRLGSGTTNPNKTNKESKDHRDLNQRSKYATSSYNQHRDPKQHSSQYEVIRNYKNNSSIKIEKVNEPSKWPHVENKQHTPQIYVHQQKASSNTNTNNNASLIHKNNSSIKIEKVSNEPSKTTNKSSLVIKITNNNNNKSSTTTPLDLNITRRPLSPVHNLEPKKNIKKRKSTSNNQHRVSTNGIVPLICGNAGWLGK